MTTNSNQSKTRRILSNQERQLIFETLLRQSENGKVKYGAFSAAAALFSVNEKTIRRIWQQAMTCIDKGLNVDVSHKLTKRVGRKRVEIDPSQISTIPLRQRTNIQSLAKATNVAKSTIHRRIKEGLMRPHSNALKPMLTEENKKARLNFCLSMTEDNEHSNNPVFSDMYIYVHIDEKWFYMTKELHKYYLLPDEEEPEPAKRNSKNRAAGTIETKPILSVTKEVLRDCLINKVLPAIRQRWPESGRRETIFIQQDNEKPHIDPSDVDFMEAASRDGFDIRLSFQPPNSSAFNVLDLGSFRAIKSLQHQEAPKTIDELVHAVEKSFEDLSVESLNRVFLTLQMCMIEAMKVYGGNGYRLPHMGKSRLEHNGNLPIQLECDVGILQSCRDFLEQQEERRCRVFVIVLKWKNVSFKYAVLLRH